MSSTTDNVHSPDLQENNYGETDPLLPVTEPLLIEKYSNENVIRDEKKGTIKGRRFVLFSILVLELCEGLAFFGVISNMVLFCTSKLGMNSDDATLVTLVFQGTVYMIPVLAGAVGDSSPGKYNTILGSILLYILGLFLLPVSAVNFTHWFNGGHDLSPEARKAYFFSGLVLVAIGTGGIKANVGPFGAQQVEDLGADVVQSFFNWFYWFFNVGAVIAYSAVAYIQQEVGFHFGYLLLFIAMVAALGVFLLAKNRYRHTEPSGSIMTKSCLICREAIHGCKSPSFDHAREDNGGSYSNEMVDGVLALLRVLPIFILVIMYWAVYAQESTTLFLQSERMDISIGGAKFPAAILGSFNTIIIIILIPVMDVVVYPLFARVNKSPSHLQRIGFGMVLSACSPAYAGVLEIFRKKYIESHGYIQQTLAGEYFNASKISMFVQVPEFIFDGSSEVFVIVSGQEFAYTQAPACMQGLITGLFLMTSGLGSYVASLIVGIVKSASKEDWFPEEPNSGHLEYFLFLMASLTIVNLFVFIIVAKFYKYRVPDFERKGETWKIISPDDLYTDEEKESTDQTLGAQTQTII